MKKITELNKQWAALRYAVDQIDLAWTYESHGLSAEEYEEKKEEMTTHRNTLLEMQNKLVDKMYAYQEINR
jgi:hypothetical protein